MGIANGCAQAIPGHNAISSMAWRALFNLMLPAQTASAVYRVMAEAQAPLRVRR